MVKEDFQEFPGADEYILLSNEPVKIGKSNLNFNIFFDIAEGRVIFEALDKVSYYSGD